MAWAIGCSAPPPTPWSTRAPIRMPRLVAAPQAAEASVKMTMHASRKRLRPNTALSHAVTGSTMAFEIK
jgi:hypothetical protein